MEQKNQPGTCSVPGLATAFPALNLKDQGERYAVLGTWRPRWSLEDRNRDLQWRVSASLEQPVKEVVGWGGVGRGR
jgi:hypothetical protein